MTAYHYAIMRVVPHVHLGAFANVGVIVHARQLEFLDMRVVEREELTRLVPDADVELLLRYLNSFAAVCRGDEEAGPIALAPTSERFHWLTAPRSDVLQCSPVHAGLTADPRREVDDLYSKLVGGN